jgi:tetratricopeptide (TPR) repeat protein
VKATIEKSDNNLPHEISSELSQIYTYLNQTPGSSFIFALYKTVAMREVIVERLNAMVEKPFGELFLSKKNKDVIALLQNYFAQNAKNHGLFLYDIEETFPDSLNNINLKREAMLDIKHPVIFWIREFAAQEIARNAPDFWGWRSEVFDFRFQNDELSESIIDQSTVVFFHKKKEDLDRRISLLRETIRLQILAGTDDTKNFAYLNNQLGLLYTQLGLYDEALSCYEIAAHLYVDVENKSGEGTALNNISQIYDARGDYDTALSYLERSLKLRQEIGNKSGEGTTLMNIGNICSARGDYDTALSYLERALKMSQEIGDKNVEFKALGNIAKIYSVRGENEKALNQFKDVLVICQEIGAKNGESTTLNEIGRIFSARGDYEAALSYFERSLKIAQGIGDKSGEGATLSNLGTIYYARGDNETALSYFERSLKMSQEIGDKRIEAVTCLNLAHIFEDRDEIERAISLVQRTVIIDAQTQHPDLKSDSTYLRQLIKKAQKEGIDTKKITSKQVLKILESPEL